MGLFSRGRGTVCCQPTGEARSRLDDAIGRITHLENEMARVRAWVNVKQAQDKLNELAAAGCLDANAGLALLENRKPAKGGAFAASSKHFLSDVGWLREYYPGLLPKPEKAKK